MKSLWIIALVILVLPVMLGCSQVRTWSIQASQEDLANAVVSRQVADNLMSTWSLNSGLAQCGLADYLPPVTLRKIQAIDQSVKDAGKWSLDDYNRGCFLGRQGELTIKSIQDLIEKLIPIVLKAVGG